MLLLFQVHTQEEPGRKRDPPETELANTWVVGFYPQETGRTIRIVITEAIYHGGSHAHTTQLS